MANLHYQLLFRSPLVTVTDVCCRPNGAQCSGEEQTLSPQIAFSRRGVFVKHLGREQVIVDSGQVIFFNGGEPYRVSHPVPGGDDCTAFEFAPAILADAIGDYDPAVRDRPIAPFTHSHGPNEPRMALVQQAFRRWLRERSGDAVAAEECALLLLQAAIGSSYRIRGARVIRRRLVTERDHAKRVGAARLLLADQFRTTLSVAAIARTVHSSPYHLIRIFRREVGLPVHRYLNRLRLADSLEQLADGPADLTTLALDLGFSSHSHFTAAFRREFGLTPSAFRCTATTTRLRELSKILTA